MAKAQQPCRNCAPRPIGDQNAWITEADYPTLIDFREEGDTTATLFIGVDGRVRACFIVRSSESSVLDQQTCRLLLRRARFQPATDRRGRPIAGQIERTVRWRLPAR